MNLAILSGSISQEKEMASPTIIVEDNGTYQKINYSTIIISMYNIHVFCSNYRNLTQL